MDKKHRNKIKGESTRIPTLIYMTSCREFKGRSIVREKDQKHEDGGRHIDRGSYPFLHDLKEEERDRS
jgi:hypothetical protein